MNRNYDLIIFFSKKLFLRRPRVAIFADIIKIVTMFFKDSRKIRTIRNYVSKWNLYLYFLTKQNLLISGKEMLMSAELKGCVTSFI